MSVQSDIDLCSRALLSLGSPAIQSFEGNSAGEVCASIYPGVRDLVLGLHPWFFTVARTSLGRLTEAPAARWKYQFQLPADSIAGPLAVYPGTASGDGPVLDWEPIGNTLHTDHETLVIDYQQRKAEANWPPVFVSFAVAALAAELAMPITEQARLYENKTVEAWGTPSEGREGGLYRQARERVSQWEPPGGLFVHGDPLTEARFGG